MLLLRNSDTKEVTLSPDAIDVISGATYTVQFDGFNNSNLVDADLWFIGHDYGNKTNTNFLIAEKFKLSSLKCDHVSYTFKIPNNVDAGNLRFDNNGSITQGFDADLYLTNIKMAQENKPGPYSKSLLDFTLGTDTSKWQKQEIFKSGSWSYATCPNGTDFGNFLKSDTVPVGFSIIRDENSGHIADWNIIKESSQFIYGMTSKSIASGVDYVQVYNGTFSGYQSTGNDIKVTGAVVNGTDSPIVNKKLQIKLPSPESLSRMVHQQESQDGTIKVI
ncbi:hypothetical protein [Companilactobacillus hulinensis]|uniref:hypothetical protein n=1 Tax=Companilactobacillus hulinensis TaxID=2486007 RepID=UPI000F76BAF1|nr:hypothetical protein [Companilactobacillus hulinensis]